MLIPWFQREVSIGDDYQGARTGATPLIISSTKPRRLKNRRFIGMKSP